MAHLSFKSLIKKATSVLCLSLPSLRSLPSCGTVACGPRMWGMVSMVPGSGALQFLHVVLWILNRSESLIFYMTIQIECPELSSFYHNLKSGTMAFMTEESPPAPSVH